MRFVLQNSRIVKKQISLTHRELLAAKYVLDSFGEMLRNQFLQVNSFVNVMVFWYFHGVEKKCIGNKWVNIDDFSAC